MTAGTNFFPASDMPLLRGPHVYLTTLAEGHREPLRRLAKDERIWEFTKRKKPGSNTWLPYNFFFIHQSVWASSPTKNTCSPKRSKPHFW